MTALTNLLGVSAFFSALYAFYTGTLNVIFGLAQTSYEAMIFVAGFGIVIGVPVVSMFSGKRIMDVHGRNLFIALILALLVIPVIVQGQYNADDLDLFADEEILIADHTTVNYYYNSTGNWINDGSLTETAVSSPEDGSWTCDFAPTAQDLDAQSNVHITWASSAAKSDTWNITAYDQDTTDYVVAMGIRISSDDEGMPIRLRLWFGPSLMLWEQTVYTSDTALNMLYFDAAFYEDIDDYTAAVALTTGQVWFELIEEDANQFVTTTDIEFELKFFTSNSVAVFREYLLYGGFAMILLGAGMTKYWNPLKRGRRRRRRRRR